MLIRNGDESATNVLLEKYRFFSWAIAKEFSAKYDYLDIPVEDYVSIAFSSVPSVLAKALEDQTIKCLYSYWAAIVRNSIKRHIKVYLTKNQHLINNTISLDELSGKDKTNSLHEVIGKNDDVENNAIKETILTIVNDKNNHFTNLQKNIVEKIFDGYSLAEISILIDKSESTLYKQYHQLVERLRTILKNRK